MTAISAATLCSGIGAPETAMPDWHWRYCAEIEPFPARASPAGFPDRSTWATCWPRISVPVHARSVPLTFWSQEPRARISAWPGTVPDWTAHGET
ncbi:hypothetical protein RAA17_16625 [Komagataeibacter rhaeticus]|nr:hypothetical protein [Komagataeibacter rhaeticus]